MTKSNIRHFAFSGLCSLLISTAAWAESDFILKHSQKAVMNAATVEIFTQDWPKHTKEVIRNTIERNGPPDEITAREVVWYGSAERNGKQIRIAKEVAKEDLHQPAIMDDAWPSYFYY